MNEAQEPSKKRIRKPGKPRPRMTDEQLAEARERKRETVRNRQTIYWQLRDALTALSGLPCAADAAEIAHLYDRNGHVQKRLPVIIQWMKDFENAWNRHEEE